MRKFCQRQKGQQRSGVSSLFLHLASGATNSLRDNHSETQATWRASTERWNSPSRCVPAGRETRVGSVCVLWKPFRVCRCRDVWFVTRDNVGVRFGVVAAGLAIMVTVVDGILTFADDYLDDKMRWLRNGVAMLWRKVCGWLTDARK